MIAGYALVDVGRSSPAGQSHDVDSSEMAFKIAGSIAFKKAAEMAKPALLEPIMGVEVVTPEDYMGDVDRRPQLAGGARSTAWSSAARRTWSMRKVPLAGNVRLR